MNVNDESFITVKNRCETEIKGITDILSYDSEKIIVKMQNSDLYVSGTGLMVKKVDDENKLCLILGTVYGFSFNDSKQKSGKNFLNSLFK